MTNVLKLNKSTQTASRRGLRTITSDDLFFLIRHDKAKTSRLKTFLSWKDVRKTARDSDDKGADAADAADDALGGGDVAGKPFLIICLKFSWFSFLFFLEMFRDRSHTALILVP